MEPTWHWKPDPERLLVTGVEGLVGANLALSLADRFDVVGLSAGHPVALPGCTTLPWTPADPAEWTDRIHRERPDWIVHCGPLGCGSWDVPAFGPDGDQEARTAALLAEVACRVGSRLTVISTDAVFAGPRLFHDERAAATGGQPLARAARQVERALEATGAFIVRTHPFGWSPPGAAPGFAERVWEALMEGRAVPLDRDRHATPILATCLADLLLAAYRRGLKGLYHVAGAERASAYRFAVELAAAFGLRGGDGLADEPALDAPGSDHLRETSLSTRRVQRQLRRPMPMLREGLDRFADQAVDGYRARLQCSVPQAAIGAGAA